MLSADSAQHRLRRDLTGFGQGVLFEVRVALGHARVAVPQELLHDIEAGGLRLGRRVRRELGAILAAALLAGAAAPVGI